MRCAALLSGGKDSVAASWKALQAGEEISCFITIRSENPESYMFHTPNILLTRLQAQAAGIPLIEYETKGIAEDELLDLGNAIASARQRFGIEGVITGAIRSVYQAARIERICHAQGLWCFSPLWLCNEEDYLHELVQAGFEILIVGVFAGPLTEEWLGKQIDDPAINRLLDMRNRFGVSVAGEGGEYESFVMAAPFFRRRIVITRGEGSFHRDSGIYTIHEACLEGPVP